MSTPTPTTIGLYDLANAVGHDIVNLDPSPAFESATEAIAGNLEHLFNDIEEATSDDPVVNNLNATNFTGTFSGDLGDMTLSVTGIDINKLFGGTDTIGTVYISNVHFDYFGAGFEFDLQAAGTGIEIDFDEVHEDRITLLDGRFESFSFTTNDLSVTAEGSIDFAYHYSVVDVPDGFGGSYSVEEASAEIDGTLSDLTIEYLTAPENYTLSLGGDIHFSMDESGDISIDGSSFTHFSISESGNYFTYKGDFTYHGDVDTGHVSGSVTEITAAVAGASFVLKGNIEVDDNDVSGYISDLTIHAAGTNDGGQPYDATYFFTGKHVDILDLFEADGNLKDIDGTGEVNEYDLVDFMLNIEGATLTGVNLPPHASDDEGITDNKTTLTVDAANGLLANDTDWEGDALTVSEVRFDGKSYTVGESHVIDDWDGTPVASFKINTDGSYEFTPETGLDFLPHGESTSGSIDYRVADTFGNTSLYAKLTITVTGANNAPEVGTTPLESDADEGDVAYQVNLLEGASDPDGDTLSVTDVTYDGSATAPAGLTLDGDTLTVDPSNAAFDSIAEDDSRTITVDYKVSDGFGGTVAQTAEITIKGVNDAPSSEDDHVTMTSEETEKVLALTDFGTFSDPDTGDTLQAVKIGSVTGGELRLYPDMVPAVAMAVGMPAPSYTLVGEDDEITWEQIENGQLRFAPGSGVNTATIGFEVGDGIDFSSESYTLTVKVAESEDVSEGGDTVLGDTTVTLPTGVSGTSETLADETLGSLEQVKAFVDSEDNLDFMVNRDDVYDKVEDYLNPLVDDVPVRKLTLTGTPDTPIVIDGGGTDQVLIIDASDLPSGTVLDLNDVPFAIIIGPGHYEGGEGYNITYAGAGSQFIVLGPGNDYSDGGAGNDVVGSEGGNDIMLGGADNDLVYGGTDDDEVYGGTGNDRVVGGSVVSAAGASTPGAITFDDGAGNLSYYVVTDDAGDDSIDGGDGDDTVVYVGPHSQYSISYNSGVYTVVDTSEGGGTDTVTNVEHFQFDDGTTDITGDTTAPVLDPNEAATAQAVGDDIVISFNEMVMPGTGEITLYKETTVVDVFGVTDSEVSFVGNTLVVNPEGNLEYGADYYVTFEDGSVLDLARNPYDYEDEDDAFHFSTLDAAVAASGGSSDGISAGAVVAGVAGLGLLAFVIF